MLISACQKLDRDKRNQRRHATPPPSLSAPPLLHSGEGRGALICNWEVLNDVRQTPRQRPYEDLDRIKCISPNLSYITHTKTLQQTQHFLLARAHRLSGNRASSSGPTGTASRTSAARPSRRARSCPGWSPGGRPQGPPPRPPQKTAPGQGRASGEGAPPAPPPAGRCRRGPPCAPRQSCARVRTALRMRRWGRRPVEAHLALGSLRPARPNAIPRRRLGAGSGVRGLPGPSRLPPRRVRSREVGTQRRCGLKTAPLGRNDYCSSPPQLGKGAHTLLRATVGPGGGPDPLASGERNQL